MNIQIPDNVKKFLNKLNEQGIPLPMLRDCLTGNPSLTYTLTLASAILVILGAIHATEGLVDYARAKEILQLVGGGYLVRQTMKHIAPLSGGDDSNNKQSQG